MSNRAKITYALVFGLCALTCQAWGLEPVDHKPIADLAAALKSNGQVRIAQGLKDVITKDANTGELFTARSILMLTENKAADEWTVSVIHDKVFGSTLIIGNNLRRVQNGETAALPTFDRQKAAAILPNLEGWGPAYYPDEMKRYAGIGFQRLFTGQFVMTTNKLFGQAMNPAFVDIMYNPNDGGFAVLVVDQYGACAKIAFGSAFSEKN